MNKFSMVTLPEKYGFGEPIRIGPAIYLVWFRFGKKHFLKKI